MSYELDRRDFLRLGLAGVSAAATYPIFIGKTALAAGAAAASAPGSDRILVVVQLSGGNDGLSTVVPYADPAYGRARSTTRIADRDVLRIDDYAGLHPNLKELKGLLDEGKMAIIQGTGYPNPTRSHFEAMDIWHAGDRSQVKHRTGWLGRAIDAACSNRPDPLLAVHLGNNVPLALQGKSSKPVCFSNPGAYRFRGSALGEKVFAEINAPAGEMGPDGEPVDFLRRVAVHARGSSETIRKAALEYRPSAQYPAGNRLANDLRLVAGLIAANLPTRVYYVSMGGFDTHANQRGQHDNLLRALSGAVSAFLGDLAARGSLDRVLVLTFSEFGRRVKENGSRGTDHGVAAPMFLFGSRVRAGLHGRHPSLTDLVGGDLAMTVDFRQVYASVLDGWLGVDAEKVLGKRYDPLDLVIARGRVRAY